MSNYLAIATVTTVLRHLLQSAMNDILPVVETTTQRPDKEATVKGPTINIFLYQVAPNTALRNVDLPTRGSNGRLSQRPRIALDLYYLITFYGDETQLEPQRMLGGAVSALHTYPVLTPQQIQAAIRRIELSDPSNYLVDSDLAAQVEHVAFTPISLTFEELSRLWSIFLQAPYALSISYRASAVSIEAELEPIRPLPAHRVRSLQSPRMRLPVIDSVRSVQGARQPITPDSSILISGENLADTTTRLRFDLLEVDPVNAEIREAQIIAALPSGLYAGVHRVQVVHWEIVDGTPRPVYESNVAPFVLQPVVVDQAWEADTLSVTLAPPVRRDQRVVLLLNEIDAPATRDAYYYVLDAPPHNGIAGEAQESAVIGFNLRGVEAGTYVFRVQVDGGESPLLLDSQQQIIGPMVDVAKATG